MRGQKPCACGWALAAAFLLMAVGGCEKASRPPPVVKDGKTYGVTSGSFRGRWWNHYERGISFADGQYWKEAEDDLRVALRLREEDHRRARTYGMHFMDYFPHRELGTVLYHQGRFHEALHELETSLKSEKSAKAEFYLDCTRKALMDQQQFTDRFPPSIEIDSPAPDTLSNASRVLVSGTVRDDAFVKTVQVNGRPVRVDLAVQEVPFRVEVPLRAGEDLIQVVAVDLSGKTSVEERRIYSDRQGPVLTIDEPLAGSYPKRGVITLKGYAHDDSGLAEIRINGHELPNILSHEAHLSYTLPEAERPDILVVEAKDRAGNHTRAEIDLSGSTRTDHSVVGYPRTHLASLDVPAPTASDATAAARPNDQAPVLELKSWTADQTVLVDQVYLEGSARDEAMVDDLTINGKSVVRKPGKSVYFNHLAVLEEGENTFRIQAKGAAGHRAEKEIHIKRKLQKVREIGSRMTMALLPLERKGLSGPLSESLEDALLGELVERGRFEMVERQRLEEILKEQKLGRTELADPGTAVRVGKIAVANCVLMGSTIEKEGSIEVYTRLVDTETSLILTAVDVYGEDPDPRTLKELYRGLIIKLLDECPLVEGTVVQVKGSKVIVDLGKESHIKKGMRLIIFEEGEPIKHPVTGAVLGSDVEELAHALVQTVHTQMSDVEILRGESFEKLRPAQKVITQ